MITTASVGLCSSKIVCKYGKVVYLILLSVGGKGGGGGAPSLKWKTKSLLVA